MENFDKSDFLHKEHLNWLQEFDFYQDEIKFFQNKLLNAVLHHHRIINMEKGADYRKTFLNYLMMIDDFRFQISLSEQLIVEKLQREEGKVYDHKFLRQEVVAFQQEFADLRSEFRVFLSNYI